MVVAIFATDKSFVNRKNDNQCMISHANSKTPNIENIRGNTLNFMKTLKTLQMYFYLFIYIKK